MPCSKQVPFAPRRNLDPYFTRARVWGVDNREAPVRLCASGGPNSQNWEFKALDATANPYLALTAILLAGCDVR